MRTPCCEWLGGCDWTARGNGVECDVWYGVVSSSLGRPVEAWKGWFKVLDSIAFLARRDRAAMVTGESTATEAWVRELAEIHRLPWVTLDPLDGRRRDEALVMLVDRVLVPWLRRGGKCDRWVRHRLASDPGSVWLSLDLIDRDLALELLALGAVGWRSAASHARSGSVIGELTTDVSRDSSLCHPAPSFAPHVIGHLRESFSGTVGQTSGSWLTHCTRGRSGPLPRQSEQSWRREVLLGGELGQPWSALYVLARILRSRRLMACPLRKEALPTISFTEMSPVEAVGHRVFRPHRCRWDFEPYGIAIRRETALALGARPVVYCDGDLEVNRDGGGSWQVQPSGKTYDWRKEREWRLPCDLDLSQLSNDEAVIFVEKLDDVPTVVPFSKWPVIVLPPANRSAARSNRVV